MTTQHYFQFYRIILALLATVFATQGRIFQKKFKKLESEKTITGKLTAEVIARSKLECSDKKNTIGSAEGNCLLVHRNSTEGDGQIFKRNNTVLYEKVFNEESSDLAVVSTESGSECQTTVTILDFGETWQPLSGWTGPNSVLYRSFDSLDGLVLVEGNERVDSVSQVSGKLNFALSLDGTRRQWVDLGIHTEACMTRPETCGAAGGAISVWINLMECPNVFLSIVGSEKAGFVTGSTIMCGYGKIRANFFLPDGLLSVDHAITTGWKHVVLNFRGPNDGQEIQLFQDGSEVQSDSSKDERSLLAGDGRIAVGNIYLHGSMDVDELIFFNQALNYEQIELLSNGI